MVIFSYCAFLDMEFFYLRHFKIESVFHLLHINAVLHVAMGQYLCYVKCYQFYAVFIVCCVTLNFYGLQDTSQSISLSTECFLKNDMSHFTDSMSHRLYEPAHGKNNKMTCAHSKDSDQPGHPPRLISVCAFG